MLALLAAALVASTASSGALPPNVRGTFVRSSHVAGCYPGEPCDQPPAAAFLLFTRNGQSTRVRLGAKGAFAVRLADGVYRVSVPPRHPSAALTSGLRF